MFGRYQLGRKFLMGGILAASVCAGPHAHAQDFTLTSSTFKDGEMLQVKNAGKVEGSSVCPGENVSPPLAWTNVPPGTKSLAIIFFDPEGENGLGAVHWIAYGIPVSVTSFAEGEVSQKSDKFVGGSSFGESPLYFGPCPPAGPPHHYTFTLIATDLEPGALPPGLTREEFLARLAKKRAAKGATGLVGLFKRPPTP